MGKPTAFTCGSMPDGGGLLIGDGTAVAQLNASGVLIAARLLQGVARNEIQDELKHQFEPAASARLTNDIAAVENLIQRLTRRDEHYPLFNLEDPDLLRSQDRLIPPIEASLPMVQPFKVLNIQDHLWPAGIPALTLLVQSAPDVVEVVSMVEHAQWLGLICGVSGRASDLLIGSVIDDLTQVGVDHITAFYAASDSALHDSLFGDGDHQAAEALFGVTAANELADVALVPLTTATLAGLEETLARLNALEVPNVSLFAIASQEELGDGSLPAWTLAEVAAEVEEAADAAHVRYQWAPPVLRDPSISLAEQARRGPRCASDLAVRIEGNGDVIPPRGPRQVAGNIIADPWPAIWQSAAFASYRSRVRQPTHCATCPGLAICAADCPKEPAGWSAGDAASLRNGA